MKSARTAGKSEAHKYWLRFQLIKHSMFNGGVPSRDMTIFVRGETIVWTSYGEVHTRTTGEERE